MPIRRELRPLYPPHWRDLSRRVRFERRRALRARRRPLPKLRPAAPRAAALSAGRALVRPGGGDLA